MLGTAVSSAARPICRPFTLPLGSDDLCLMTYKMTVSMSFDDITDNDVTLVRFVLRVADHQLASSD